MNEYDLLLQWFSSRPHGEASTALLKEACLALDQRATATQEVPQKSRWPYRFQDTLYRCGHIEHIGLNTWAVMPPTVVWLGGKGKRQEGAAHVYGARSPSLQAHLQQAWGSQFVVMSQPHGPAVWTWIGTRAQSKDFARSFRSAVYEERGEDLLAALPSLPEAVQHFRAGPSPAGNGWEFWYVTPSPPRGVWWNWVRKPQVLLQGIYRTSHPPRLWVYVSPKPQNTILCTYHLNPTQYPDHLSIAQWHELARSGCLSLRYDASGYTLIIPHVNVALPLLVDRALRLASGCCPGIMSGTHGRAQVFTNIERRRACQAARVLGIPLEVTHG